MTNTSGSEERMAYKDPSLPIEERVADLISRMTLKEKASQMVHPAADIPNPLSPPIHSLTSAL